MYLCAHLIDCPIMNHCFGRCVVIGKMPKAINQCSGFGVRNNEGIIKCKGNEQVVRFSKGHINHNTTNWLLLGNHIL